MIRLLVADDHRSFLEAVAALLDDDPDVQVVATVSRPDDVVRAARATPADVAVLTVDGEGEDYLGVVPGLRAASPAIGLVAVAEGRDVAVLARAVRAGCRAWVSKTDGVDVLVDAVRGVHRGETRVPPLLLTDLLARLLRDDDERRAAEARLATLTARERQVLATMAEGWTAAEIADELGISTNTVRTHTQNILAKLEVHTSLAAVALARGAGVG